MKISWNWLQDFLPSPISLTAPEAARILTAQGLEVESVSEIGHLDDRIVVGHVLEKRPHPGADRLSLCQVAAGGQVFPVVCGAPNVMAGGYYPFAQLGAVLPDGMTIKKAKIRGEASEGMLCSETELELPFSQDGLLTLPMGIATGVPIGTVSGIHDFIFEINITPNRGDCLSHLGIARELYAHFPEWERTALESPRTPESIHAMLAPSPENPVQVRIADSAAAQCPLYAGMALQGVAATTSPFWVRRRLLACGIRPINSIVDATNYILLERGHPVHAFDLKKIRGAITVRTAHPAEKIVALDGVEYRLAPKDVIIADENGPVAIAGIMGGDASKVDEETAAIFLECAVFAATDVRCTSKRLGLASESSYRFERGVNPTSTEKVLTRLAELIAAWSGETTVQQSPLVIAKGKDEPRALPEIRVSLDRLERFLGVNTARQAIRDIVGRLETVFGFVVRSSGDDEYYITPPAYRHDIEHFADIAEEVARLLGYDAIPKVTPSLGLSTRSCPSSLVRELRAFLKDRGFSQTIHFSFTSESEAREFVRSNIVKVKNPLSEREAVLRQTMSHALLDTYAGSEREFDRDWRLFEIGNVFSSSGLLQSLHLAIVWASGSRSDAVDFYDMKGIAETILALAHWGGDVDVRPIMSSEWRHVFHPGRSAALVIAGEEIGFFGQLHPELAKARKLRQSPLLLELSLEALHTARAGHVERRYRAFSLFPGTHRDLSVVADEDMPYGELADWFQTESTGTSLLTGFDLISLYRGESLPAGKKSISLRLYYGSRERTLTDEEVNVSYFALIDKVKREKKLEIRQ